MSTSTEEKRENGSAMVAIGWVMMLFAFLVIISGVLIRRRNR